MLWKKLECDLGNGKGKEMSLEKLYRRKKQMGRYLLYLFISHFSESERDSSADFSNSAKSYFLAASIVK